MRVQVQYMKEGEMAVVYSPSLELSGYGKTWLEAEEDFRRSVKIFIEETTANHTFEKALLTLGWKRVDHHWQPQVEIISNKTENIAIPA